MSFKDRVVIITGAGAGLGRDYALYFAKNGAKVVVNDLGGSTSGQGQSSKASDLVVEEIRKRGGIAVANYDSVENGENIIKTALDNFGRVDVLVNNAGILRDKAFKNLEKIDWDLIVKVHLNGVYSCTKAVWNLMIKQKYGRIINVSSPSGLYGSFGQANYSTAKAGIIGFTKTLAKEGEKYGIKVNCIAPVAATRMTEDILSKEIKELMKVEFITPIVAFLSHEDCLENGAVYETAGSWISKLRWQRSEGVFFGKSMSMEEVKNKIEEINDFSKNNTYFDEDQTSIEIIIAQVEKMGKNKTSHNIKF